ncbi:host cell division inhibitory peptide Kil [Klebsiella aerogenes]
MVLKMINHNLLRAARSKAAIAIFLRDGDMWIAANQKMKAAAGMPWYRRGNARV